MKKVETILALILSKTSPLFTSRKDSSLTSLGELYDKLRGTRKSSLLLRNLRLRYFLKRYYTILKSWLVEATSVKRKPARSWLRALDGRSGGLKRVTHLSTR